MFGAILSVVFLLRSSLAVIYTLNETEYNKMPALYHLDDYETCLAEPGGTYCLIDGELFTKDTSELMRMIEGYSVNNIKHFNHTQLHRGICVNTCSRYNVTTDLKQSLEECLNESIWREYKIEVKIANIQYCNKHGTEYKFDVGDILVAVIYILILVMNIVGSIYDATWCKNRDSKGNALLLSFALRRNWTKLTAPTDGGSNDKLRRLKIFHGLRTMTMICVFFSHTVLIMTYGYVDNPLFIEKSYEDPTKQILFNGSLVINTFFVMSSFLLTYNFQLHVEKHGASWILWPKGVLMRWLRLTPTYALILATICTWMRYLGSGPMWELIVGAEASACRQYWWAHLLYINNYVYDDSGCAPQTWYLAADTQLFCLGLLVLVIARTSRAQKISLVVMLLLSLTTVAAHTYFQNLGAIVVQSPEVFRNLYAQDDTFRLLYIRGHTNLSSCTIGMAAALIVFYWQKNNKDLSKYKKYRPLYWLMFPLGVAVILSGGLFYIDGYHPATAVRVIYATFYKTVFQLMLVVVIIGCMCKYENIYRCVLEWRGFTWTGRVSYSAFLLHTLFQRGLVAAQARPTYMSEYYVLVVLTSTIFLAYLSAVALWLLVEAPAAALVKAAFAPRDTHTEPDETKV